MIVEGIKLQTTVHFWLGIVIFFCKTLVQCNQDTLYQPWCAIYFKVQIVENSTCTSFFWVENLSHCIGTTYCEWKKEILKYFKTIIFIKRAYCFANLMQAVDHMLAISKPFSQQKLNPRHTKVSHDMTFVCFRVKATADTWKVYRYIAKYRHAWK